MKVKTKTSDSMAAEPSEVTSTIAHKDSSSEPGNITTSTAQKDSSSDNASEESVESGGAVVPSSSSVQTVNVSTSAVQTVNAQTSTVVPAYTRPYKPLTTNNADAMHLIIPNTNLHFNNIDAAIGDGLIGRQAITIENDDVAVVKTNQQTWVNRLVSAFTINYLSTPEDTTKNAAQREWFSRWQKQGHATLVTIINGKDPKHLEQSCWFLLKGVLNAHELGIVDAGGNLAPSEVKCSERLALIVSMLEKYALVRLDVLRAWHVDEIAANPEAFIKRKLVNLWNNAHRAEKAKEEKAKKEKAEKEAKEKAEKEAKKVAGTKRAAGQGVEQEEGEEDEVETPVKAKKARQSKADAADEQSEVETPVKAKKTRQSKADAVDEQSEVETPVKAKKARTRKSKADVAEDGAKKDGKTKPKTKATASTKHPRSALTPDSDDKESTPTKSSATSKAKAKAPSGDDVEINDDESVGDMDED